MSDVKEYKHWNYRKDDSQIAWLTLDRADSSTNTLNGDVLSELKRLLIDVKNEHRPRAMIIASGKSNGFVAGADIAQFKHIKDIEVATDLVREGQQVFDVLASMDCPTVAAINGFCLGGGFELALACRYRVAIDSPKTRLGLPEILLGLHPGWGGTVRLPRMIGSLKAMDLILSGRTVAARSAKKMGIVDAAVPERHFEAALKHYALNEPDPKEASVFEYLVSLDIIRPLIAKVLRKQVGKKARPSHYPAPYAVIDNWVEQGIRSDDAYIAEAVSFGKLMVSSTAQNLVRLFFLRDELKGLSKGYDAKVKHVHVVGAGVMGGDIAAWCALRGFSVTLQDENAEAIGKTFQRALKLFEKKLKLPHLVQQARDRLSPDVKGHGIPRADLIIEAIIEDKSAKQTLFSRLEGEAKPEAILATNTSTIPLEEIAESLKSPDRLVGIHFFNPVPQMMLVEVVQGKQTSPAIFERSLAFVGKIDKLPLPVQSSPGFLVNRLLMPYLMESFLLLEEGVPIPVIDEVAKAFGMPMGPVELADTVGLDVCQFAGESLSKYFGGEVPNRLKEMVSSGKLGKKSGSGFYKYKKGKKQKIKNEFSHQPASDISDRLMLRIINEAVACMREGVIVETDHIDAGMIFGAGFAPFRGGPMNYIWTEGKNKILQRLESLADRYGERFTPDAGWQSLEEKQPVSSLDIQASSRSKELKNEATG